MENRAPPRGTRVPAMQQRHTAPAALVNGQTAAFVFHLSASLSAPSLVRV